MFISADDPAELLAVAELSEKVQRTAETFVNRANHYGKHPSMWDHLWKHRDPDADYRLMRVIHEVLSDEMTRNLYMSPDIQYEGETRQHGLEYLYREAVEQEAGFDDPSDRAWGNVQQSQLPLMYGAQEPGDLTTSRVLTSTTVATFGQIFQFEYTDKMTEIVLLWLGNHGVLTNSLAMLTDAFTSVAYPESKVSIDTAKQLLQLVLLSAVVNTLLEHDETLQNAPWEWSRSVYAISIMERLGDQERMQYLMDGLLLWNKPKGKI